MYRAVRKKNGGVSSPGTCTKAGGDRAALVRPQLSKELLAVLPATTRLFFFPLQPKIHWEPPPTPVFRRRFRKAFYPVFGCPPHDPLPRVTFRHVFHAQRYMDGWHSGLEPKLARDAPVNLRTTAPVTHGPGGGFCHPSGETMEEPGCCFHNGG